MSAGTDSAVKDGCKDNPNTSSDSSTSAQGHAKQVPEPSEPSAAINGVSTAIFFARVPPSVPYDVLLALFSKYGEVKHLNLYKRWATAKTSKGCGLVEYGSNREAKAAKDALHGVYMFDAYEGCESPMVIEWMDATRLTPPDAAKVKKAASKPQARHHSNFSRQSSSSSNRSSSGSLPRQAWPKAQHLHAMAQRDQAAAAAAAAAGYGLPAPTGGACARLGVAQQCHSVSLHGMSHLQQYNTDLGCAAAAAAASAAAAAAEAAAIAQALSPMSAGTSLDLLTSAQHSPLSPFSSAGSSAPNLAHSMACSAPNLAHSMACMADPSTVTSTMARQLSALSGTYPACTGSALSPSLHPLLLPDDSWAKDNFLLGVHGGPAGDVCCASGPMSSAQSGSYSLFDSSAFLDLAQLQEEAASACMSSQTCPSPSTLSSAWAASISTALSTSVSSLAPDAWNPCSSRHVGDLSGALPGRSHGLLGHVGAAAPRYQQVARAGSLDGCMILPLAPEPDTGLCSPDSALMPDQTLGRHMQQRLGLAEGLLPQGLKCVELPLSLDLQLRLGAHLQDVESISGGKVLVHTRQGCAKVVGTEAQVQRACELLRFLDPLA